MIVGLDISKLKMDACIVTAKGRASKVFANSPRGADQLFTWAKERSTGATPDASPLIVMEATGKFHARKPDRARPVREASPGSDAINSAWPRGRERMSSPNRAAMTKRRRSRRLVDAHLRRLPPQPLRRPHNRLQSRQSTEVMANK